MRYRRACGATTAELYALPWELVRVDGRDLSGIGAVDLRYVLPGSGKEPVAQRADGATLVEELDEILTSGLPRTEIDDDADADWVNEILERIDADDFGRARRLWRTAEQSAFEVGTPIESLMIAQAFDARAIELEHAHACLTEALVELGDALSAHLECAAEVLDELDRCLTIDECDATTVARCDGDAQRQLAACPPLSPTAKQRFDDCRP